MSKIRKLATITLAITMLGANMPFNVMAETVDTNKLQPMGEIQENPWEADDFTYEDEGKTITGFSEKGKEKLKTNKYLIIPEGVTKIGDAAFKYNELTNVSISDTVTTIGNRAFSNNQITEATIPNKVITIEHEAFQHNQLEKLNLGKSVTTIEYGAFADNKLTELRIPDSIITIGMDAFGQNHISELTLGNSLITIESYAFQNNRITNVTIPDSVREIGECAFITQIIQFYPKQNPFELKDIGITLKGLEETIDDISAYVESYDELNKDNEKLSFPKNITETALNTKVVPEYQYNAYIVTHNPGKYVKDIGMITPIPEVIKDNIETEVVSWGKDIDLTDNIKNLPNGSKVEDITDIDINTKTPGEYKGKVKVTFKNGSSRIVQIPIAVLQEESNTFEPKIEKEIVDKNKTIELTDNITNLPSEATIKDITSPKIDTSKVGEHQGKVEITFKDGSKKEIIIPVEVQDIITPTPQPKYTTSNFIQGEIKIIDRTKEATNTQYDKTNANSYWVFKIGELDYKFVTKETEKRYTADVKPFIKDDRAYLPFRFVGNALKIDVGYDNATRLATFTKATNHLEINIDTGKATKNKLVYNLETNPMLVNSRLVAPVSVIGKAFNKTVSNYKEKTDTDIVWNPNTQEVIIYNYK